MLARLLVVLLSLVWAGIAQHRGEVRGYVMDLRDNPMDGAEIEACDEKAKDCPQSGITGPDGSYQLALPSGQYSFKISARGFYSTEIRGVQIDGPVVKMLPVIRLDVGLIADCGIDRRPDYYRLPVGAAEAGAVGGLVASDKGIPIAGATVTLYMQGYGPIGSQKTNSDGTFSFRGLQPRSEEYWVSIARDAFFSEEVRHLNVSPGLEGVYSPIALESCGHDHCQPHLKTIRVLWCE